MSTCSGALTYAASRSFASHSITLRTSLLSEQLDVFYWKNNFSLCVSVSTPVLWLHNKYVRPFVEKGKKYEHIYKDMH